MSIDLSMENLGSMIDNIIAGICFFEYESTTKKLTPFFINEGLFRMLGYSRVQGMKYLQDIRRSVIPDDIPILEQGIEDVLKEAESQFDKLPNGTIMGHLHLHVSNLDETYKFYHNVLGLGAKLVMGNHVLFLASGNYHHHLGTNLWQGRNLPAPSEGMQGLKAALWIADKADFEKVKENLIKYSIEFKQDGESLLFKDNSGLPIILNQKN